MTKERRRVMSDHQGSNKSVSRQFFLTEMAILFKLSNDRQGLGCRIVTESAIIYRQVIHVNLLIFFCYILQDHGLLGQKNFDTIAMSCNEFSSL